MAKEVIKSVRFSGKSRNLLDQIIPIAEEYSAQGVNLSLRQFFYQLVARLVFANTQKNYKKLGRLVSDARYAGIIDWDLIEDRHRELKTRLEFNDVREGLDTLFSSFRLPRWQDQPEYVEVWVEKSALASVLEPVCDKYHVNLVVNKGFASDSFIYEAVSRFRDKSDRECTILYFGDHDPSGLAMDEDIKSKMELFGVKVDFERVALKFSHVQEFGLLPNPAKEKDGRSKDYKSRFGNSTYELDALEPNLLAGMAEKAILGHLNQNKYSRVLDLEACLKEKMLSLEVA